MTDAQYPVWDIEANFLQINSKLLEDINYSPCAPISKLYLLRVKINHSLSLIVLVLHQSNVTPTHLDLSVVDSKLNCEFLTKNVVTIAINNFFRFYF